MHLRSCQLTTSQGQFFNNQNNTSKLGGGEVHKETEKMKAKCQMCDNEIEVQMCCDGRGCGCQGGPIDPPVCSNGCLEKLIQHHKDLRENPPVVTESELKETDKLYSDPNNVEGMPF